jgi:uncharacterized membrane protein
VALAARLPLTAAFAVAGLVVGPTPYANRSVESRPDRSSQFRRPAAAGIRDLRTETSVRAMTEVATNVLKTPINKARLEFLYDGIFAIAMTILVLELKIPEIEQRRSGMELLRALAHHAPAFGSWLLSIVMLGIFWFQHQRLYHWLERITKTMFVIHLGMMTTAAFFPFCAALIGRFPANRAAMLAYIGCAWLHVTLLASAWLLAEHRGLLSPHLAPTDVRRVRRRYLRGCIAIFGWAVIYFLIMPRL